MKIKKLEMNNSYRLLFIFVLLQDSAAEISIKEVSCTAGVSACPSGDICRVHCNDDCIKNEGDIYGTVFYSQYSPICKSAIHDFRISSWNTSERSATFRRGLPRNVFFGSKRMRFVSNLTDVRGHLLGEDGIRSYMFLSPYISEKVLDIASIHTDYLFGGKCSHRQICFESEESSILIFDEYFKSNIKELCLNPASRGGVSILQALWTIGNQSGSLLNAGYQCFPENRTLSTITSIAFKKSAYFYPTTLTKTVNVNEEVSLHMTENRGCEDKPTIWRKDGGDVISREISRTSIFFPKVEVGHTGIYSLECSNSDPSRAGFVHLIVRACPEGKHGNLCIDDCPKCLNGGVCHDFHGECICAPGFHGPTCEKACPPGFFGRKCDKKCSPFSVPGERACKEVSICLPHPYGCSCGSGYGGIFCNETCKSGTFGAGCREKRECHCANGEGCNIYNGSCIGDCAEKWFGKYCDVYGIDLSIDFDSSLADNVTWKVPFEIILLFVLLHIILHFSI